MTRGVHQAGNSVGTVALAGRAGDENACLDALPLELKWAIWEGVIAWSPFIVRDCLLLVLAAGFTHKRACRAVVAKLQDSNAEEIAGFARRWPGRWGSYPHVAAQATVQPYDARKSSLTLELTRFRGHFFL